MHHATRVEQLWRHQSLDDLENDYTPLVHYATLAASSHNTQPWTFELSPGRVRLLPDYSRRCPVVDPDDHHLFASLGCAAENLLLAARAAGWRGHLSHLPSQRALQVELEAVEKVEATDLFQAIPLRQCSRTTYDGTPLTASEARQLEEAAKGSGVSLLLLTEPAQLGQVADYVAAGNTAQFGDPLWRKELLEWIRFNGREAVERGDGLYGPVMGSPDVPRWLGETFMRLAFSARAQNRKDHAQIKSSGAIAVILSDRDDWVHWSEAGRSYERLALCAAALGLRTAFVNQPVEVAPLREQFAAYLGTGGRRPDLVVRIGRGPSMPRSVRRPLEQVIRRTATTP